MFQWLRSKLKRWRGVREDVESFGSVPDPGLSNQNFFRQWVGIYQLVDRMARARGGVASERPLDERMLYIARGLMRYNSYAQGFINALRMHTLGSNGLVHRAVGPSAKPVQVWLDKWKKETDWWQREREIYERVHIEGEAVPRFFCSEGDVELRMIEPEWIVAPDGSEEWTYGFYNEPGDVETVTALYTQYGAEHEEVDWQEWYHVKSKLSVRADKRGRSDFLSTAPLLDDSFKVWRNFLNSEAVRQSIIYFTKNAEGVTAEDLEQAIAAEADYSPPEPAGGKRQPPLALQQGAGVEHLPANTELASAPAAENIQGVVTGTNAGLLAVGRAYHMPLVLMSGDMSANNTLDFGDESPFGMTIADEQRWYCGHVRNILMRAMEFAADDGAVPADALDDGTEILVTSERKPGRDPEKATNRSKMLNDAGIISKRRWSELEGEDYEEQQAQIAAEPKPPPDPSQAMPGLEEGPGLVEKEITVHRGGKTFTEKRKVRSGSEAPKTLARVGQQAHPEHHKAAIAKAIAKFSKVPKPTKQELSEAKAGLKKYGANKYRKNLVGNSKDRAKRRQALYTEFGDGKSCPCVYCGIVVSEGTLEQDKILTTAQGGRYRMPNLIPSCSGCNKTRSDTPFGDIVEKLKNAAAS